MGETNKDILDMEHMHAQTEWLTTKEKAEEERLSPRQVMRRAKKGLYPGAYQVSPYSEWRFPASEVYTGPLQALTGEQIAIQEEQKQKVFGHFEDLHAMARRWKSELWLPPPWRWDVADLKYVFYVDRREVNRGKETTGYKLPADLLDSEESKGHFRYFAEGCVYWVLQEDGAIVLKLPVEDEAAFCHLKVHTEESPAWGLFAEWKEEGGIYIQLCSSLLARIEQDAKAAIGAKSELSWWAIYHDAFCTKDTLLRCGTCGTENPSAFVCPSCDGKFSRAKELELHIGDNHLGVDPKAWPLPRCQNCPLLLGWLRPILRQYESTTEGLQSTPIHVHGWGNIEESVEIGRFEGMKRGHRDLKVKYQGHDLVETILQREEEIKEIRAELNQEVESLSQQRGFAGSCEACPL